MGWQDAMADGFGSLEKMAEKLSSTMRTVQDVSAAAHMVSSIGGSHQAAGHPFGIGESSSGPGYLLSPGGVEAYAKKIGWNLTGGMAVGMATDAARVGFLYGNKNEQAVGQSMADTTERMVDKAVNVAIRPTSPKAWVELGAEVAAIIPTLASWGEALLQSTEHLSQFGTAMAAAQAKMKIGEAMRARETAEATGESTLGLAIAWEELMNELQPIRHAITNLLNAGLTKLIEIATEIMKIINAMFFDSQREKFKNKDMISAHFIQNARMRAELMRPVAAEVGFAHLFHPPVPALR